MAKSFEFFPHKIKNSNLAKRATWQCRRFCAATNETPPCCAETTNARFNPSCRLKLQMTHLSGWTRPFPKNGRSHRLSPKPTLLDSTRYCQVKKNGMSQSGYPDYDVGTSDAAANSRDVFRSGVPRQPNPYQLLIFPPLICLAG